MNQMLPFVLMIPVFYFFIIRPKQKEMKQTEEMLKNLKKGDEVVTSAGIIGSISNVTNDRISLKVGDNNRLEMTKSSVIRVLQAASNA